MSSEVNILLEKATSPLLLDIDWDSTLQIVDLIRQGDVNPKSAVQSLLNRLKDTNPNVVLLALQVLESVVKNCGQSVHEHVASRAVMEQFHDILRTNPNEEVRKKILLLLATWVYAFRNEVKYRAVQDIVNILRAEGFHMPQVSESDAMFTADRAPDWADGECCHRCRSQFTMIRRKHHCRACGQVFCGDCSSKSSTIPKFGIERDVRVCESCYEDINNAGRQSSGIDTLDREGDILADKQRPSHTATPAKVEAEDASNVKPAKEASDKKSAEEMQEEEEFQLALALSKSEAENKEKEKLRATSNLLGGNWRQTSPTPSPAPASPGGTSPVIPIKDQDMDPELARYLNRSYWEQQQQQIQPQQKTDVRDSPLQQPPSAPITTTKIHSPSKFNSALTIEKYQNGETEELDEFVSTLKSSLEIFVNRMKSNQSRGRPIANDTSVQSLFMNITAMHAHLLKYIHQHDEKRVKNATFKNKTFSTVSPGRVLLAFRQENIEKYRFKRDPLTLFRQMQMMQKLEIMRKKKQEYLEYQRQLAMHRMVECEREIYGKGPGAMGPGGPGNMAPPGGPNMPPTGAPGFPHMPYQPYTGGPGQIGGYMYPPEGGTPQGGPPPSSLPYQQPGQSQQQPAQQGPGPNYQAPPSGHVMPPPAGQQNQQPPPHNYDPYNMGAMANSLPPSSGMAGPGYGPPPGHPQGPPVGGMPPGGGPPQMAPGPPHQMPGPGPVGQGQPTQPAADVVPPQQLPPVSSPQDQQAELISFD
ncbi:unnamed protein product, partial [Meganyctiphanes norvegica]